MLRTRLLVLVALLLLPAAAWPQGNPLGPEFRVNAFTTGNQSFQDVAQDAAGNFVVVWQSWGQDGSNYGVFGQRYDTSGAALGPEFRVNTYTTDNQYTSAVAADAAGNFVVVWESNGQDGSSMGVFGQRFANSGSPLGSEFRANTYTTGFQGLPAVALDGSGSFVVVWTRTQLPNEADVFGQRYASSGVPVGTEFRVNTYTTAFQMRPAVASIGSGDFIVVWESYLQDGSRNGVFGQRYSSSGNPLGPEFRVNTSTTDAQQVASVAADPSGNYVVVWESLPLPGADIFGQRYASTGAPLGPEFQVNTSTVAAVITDLAVDGSGNFVVVWQSFAQDGSNWGIFGQRYASSGTPVGSEFQVNTYTTAGQQWPTVAADSAGNFVVVWASPHDFGTYGVFGQRYSQIVPVELMHFKVE